MAISVNESDIVDSCIKITGCEYCHYADDDSEEFNPGGVRTRVLIDAPPKVCHVRCLNEEVFLVMIRKIFWPYGVVFVIEHSTYTSGPKVAEISVASYRVSLFRHKTSLDGWSMEKLRAVVGQMSQRASGREVELLVSCLEQFSPPQ